MTLQPPASPEKKLVIHLDELEQVFAYLRTINMTRLEDIEWRRDNVPLAIHPKVMEEWKYIGLSNEQFPRMCMGWIKSVESGGDDDGT